MIAHLTGNLLEKQLQRLVIQVGGVGYEVLVPLSTLYAVGEPGSIVSLHVHTHVREDAIQLFGFAAPLEMTLFERLIGISGIGPKVALAVLSGIEPAELVRAIRGADLARLTSIPGVGKKTAERIVIELRDRLPQSLAPDTGAAAAASPSVRDDVLSALANLGYQRAAAERAVDRVLANAVPQARPAGAERGTGAPASDGDRGSGGTKSPSMEFEPLLREVLKELAR